MSKFTESSVIQYCQDIIKNRVSYDIIIADTTELSPLGFAAVQQYQDCSYKLLLLSRPIWEELNEEEARATLGHEIVHVFQTWEMFSLHEQEDLEIHADLLCTKFGGKREHLKTGRLKLLEYGLKTTKYWTKDRHQSAKEHLELRYLHNHI